MLDHLTKLEFLFFMFSVIGIMWGLIFWYCNGDNINPNKMQVREYNGVYKPHDETNEQELKEYDLRIKQYDEYLKQGDAGLHSRKTRIG